MTKYVYQFDEGNKDMKDLLGGKGANLAEMTTIGLPVPQGFTVTTEVCERFHKKGEKIDEGLEKEILENLKNLEEKVRKKLGDNENPLLLSVRSGTPISMPGMMDTVLNIGLNDETVEIFGKSISSKRTAYDSYRRPIQMFGDVVMNISMDEFEGILDDVKERNGYENDLELTTEDLKLVVKRYKEKYKEKIGEDFPQDPKEQPLSVQQLLHPTFDNKELKKAEEIAEGLAASPGAVFGKIYFTSDDVVEAAEKVDMKYEDIKYIVNSLKEYNPMLGHRGCRLGMTNPEIYDMQTKAIITAAVEVEKGLNISITPQIMLPLVGIEEEIATIRENVIKVADPIIKEENSNLTQMTFGFSRDDADMYLKSYIKQGIFNVNPFESIDTKGVGMLMDRTVKLGRKENPNLHIGICGEHGGDPASIVFCDKIGLDYVSCSPYLVPVARLAAAQAAIINK